MSPKLNQTLVNLLIKFFGVIRADEGHLVILFDEIKDLDQTNG